MRPPGPREAAWLGTPQPDRAPGGLCYFVFNQKQAGGLRQHCLGVSPSKSRDLSYKRST